MALSVLAVLASGCTLAPRDAPPSFLRTSADIVLPPGNSYPISVPFIAATNNRIWDSTASFGLPDSDVDVAGGFSIATGARRDGLQYGWVTFNVSLDTAGSSLDAVELGYSEGETTRAAVGSWTMRSSGTQEFLWDSGGYATNGCSTLPLELPPGATDLVEVRIAAPGVDILGTSMNESKTEVYVDISCSPDYDHYILTPEFIYLDARGEQARAFAAPITLDVLVDDTP